MIEEELVAPVGVLAVFFRGGADIGLFHTMAGPDVQLSKKIWYDPIPGNDARKRGDGWTPPLVV